MTFWGVEVKSGSPFTLEAGSSNGQLHISQATMGLGSGSKKSILQCNVGKNAPILLCALIPDKNECCPLDLVFDEDEDVTFSVLGPKSIHLSGYYSRPSCGHDGDETDSYGEDIDVETGSEESSDMDNEYEDDGFIVDELEDDSEDYPMSPKRRGGVKIEEIIDDDNLEKENGGTKRISKKKHQISNQLAVINNESLVEAGNDHVDLENKDSSRDKKRKDNDESAHKTSSGRRLVKKHPHHDSAGSTDEEALEDFISEDEDGLPITKGSRKEQHEDVQSKVNKENEISDSKEARKNEESAVAGSKRKIDSVDGEEKLAASEPVDIEHEVSAKKKKKKGKKLESSKSDTLATEASQNGSDTKPHQQETEQENIDASKETKKKKKKKKSKTAAPSESVEGKESNGVLEAGVESDKAKDDSANDTADEKPRKGARTFANGLIIEQLSMGNPDGKIANPGSKVSVHYIGKLKKNGQIFDSNIGQRPFKFRLGIGQVIKGWDVGVKGMRVGAKRRITIPPSMGYGSEGSGKTIPGNSWLVFDVELVAVS